MSQQVNKLMFVLQEMIEVFEKLLLTASDKQEQLVHMDIKSLDRCVKKEVELFDQLMSLEEQSGTILNEINQVFLSANSLVLTKFVNRVKNDKHENSDELCDIYTKLKNMGNKLKSVNKQNQNLARFSQEAIKGTIRFICKETSDNARYRQDGEIEDGGALLNLVDTHG